MHVSEAELQVVASAGNLGAQYQLGMRFLQRNNINEALFWLRKSAEQEGGHEAQTLLGMLFLMGSGVEPDTKVALQFFQSAASAGNSQAMLRCAELLYSGKTLVEDRQAAINYLKHSAFLGYPLALRGIAFQMLAVDARLDADGFRVLRIAAYAGDAHAQYTMGLLLQPHRKNEANAWFGLAMKAGIYLAGKYYCPQLLTTDLIQIQGDISTEFAILQKSIAKFHGAPTATPSLLQLSKTCNVRASYNFMFPWETDYLINFSAQHLQDAKVVIENQAEAINQIRTGMTSSLANHLDVTLDWLVERVWLAVEIPKQHAEPAVVINYKQGQFYKTHGDYLPIDSNLMAPEYGRQRIRTALVYLNDDFVGGETAFPELKLVVTPVRGKLLLFDSCNPEGRADLKSVHTGCEVSAGEKWLLSIWFRQSPITHR